MDRRRFLALLGVGAAAIAVPERTRSYFFGPWAPTPQGVVVPTLWDSELLARFQPHIRLSASGEVIWATTYPDRYTPNEVLYEQLVGDGVHNDSRVIQELANRRLPLPGGREYRIDDPVHLKAGAWLTAGEHSRIVSTGGLAIAIEGADVRVSNLRIDGPLTFGPLTLSLPS
jgi:hypothetical protein